jgi:transglutaminase-like putative cysteine protease
VAGFLRLALGRDGRRLLPHRALVALSIAVATSSVAYLFDQLARGSAESLAALMAVVCVFQGLCLLGRQTTFCAFLLILLSSVHAAGGAIEHKDLTAVWFIVGYVVVLAWTLLVFERRISLERATEAETATRRVRAPGATRLPVSIVARVIGALVVIGFPLGVLLYLAAPRHVKLFDLTLTPEEREAAEATVEDDAAPTPFESRGTMVATTGPGKGVPFGSVAKIKKDFRAWFEVWETGRAGVPRYVVLRENVKDFYDAETNTWGDTLSVPTRDVRVRDRDDGKLDGWLEFGGRPLGRNARTLRIEYKVGGLERLFLWPEVARLQLLRDGRPQSGFEIVRRGNLTYKVGFEFQVGDQVLEVFEPPPRDDGALVGRRSDRKVSPSLSYLDVPARCEGALRARAEAVVGAEQDPWRRARLLEAWLRSDAFTYTLELPRLDPANPIVDFVERTRSSSCEGFAIALTLMLRTLGHPTRYVRGFWGGDPQELRGSVIVRGHHYHAWTEMYLDGIGWVPLNPTPPDRRPADADTFTVAPEEAEDEADDEPFSFLGYDAGQWSRFWSGVGRALRTYVVEPLAVLFGGRGGYVGFPLVALTLLLLMRGTRSRRARRQVVAAGRRLPPGPYGRALLLLGRKGMRRRPSQTPRAFGRVAAQRFPAAGPALDVLTRVHERERYGGGASAEARQKAGRALGDLKDALKKRAGQASA